MSNIKRFLIFFLLFLLLLLFTPYLSISAPIYGIATSVSNGDTITMYVKGLYIKITLAHIECPKLSDRFGEQAKRFIEKMVKGKNIRFHETGKDKNGIMSGVVYINSICLNKTLIKNGFAWHDKKGSDDKSYIYLEKQAKTSGKGLWTQTPSNPMPKIPANKDEICQEQIQTLLDKYGKTEIISYIYSDRDYHITLDLKGKLKDFSGRADPQYITNKSIKHDFKIISVSVSEADDRIAKNIKKKEKIAAQRIATQRNKQWSDDELKKILLKEKKRNKSLTSNQKRRSLSQQQNTIRNNDYIPPRKTRSIEKEINDFSKRKYPNDYRMQQYIYKKQIVAYNYMLKVNDLEVKGFSVRKYPDDYSMQKYTYDKQLSAKRYMSSVGDGEVKKFSVRKYPDDYSMQKYTYDKQLSAKRYMSSVGSQSAKIQAARKYPYDYSMQKYTYDKLAY